MAATPAAMPLLRLLENICLTPVCRAINLRYRRPRWKCRGRSAEGGREVVQRELTAKASANGPQGHAKATGTVDPPNSDKSRRDSSGQRGTVIGWCAWLPGSGSRCFIAELISAPAMWYQAANEPGLAIRLGSPGRSLPAAGAHGRLRRGRV